MKRIFPIILIVLVLAGGVGAYRILRSPSASSKDYLESGRKYFEQKKYSEAAIEFSNALKKDERNRDARFLLALSYSFQGNLKDTIKQLQTLLEIFPDDTEANLQLGNIYLAGAVFDSKLYDRAVESAQKVLAKDPNNLSAILLSANAAVGLQDYSSSTERYEKALSLDPQNISAFVSLGTSQTIQKNYPEAEKAFLKARELSPKDPSVLVSLANFYATVGQYPKAESAFRDALSLYPSKRDVYLPAALLYYLTDKFEDGEKVLQTAQARNPKDPDPSFVLYELYQAKNRTADAEKLLLDLQKKYPNNGQVAIKTAVHFMQSKPEVARATIDGFLKNDPKNSAGRILLGELQFISGQYDAAQGSFSSPEAINSAYPQPHFFLGSIALKKGQVDKAQDEYQKSLSVDSQYSAARVALADLLLTKGRTADARAEIEKVLKTQPGLASARLIKASLDRMDKKYPDAERELLKLEREQPKNPLVQRQLGLYFESRGRTSEAEKSFLHGIELQPDSQELLQDAVLFYVRAQQTDRALQLIHKIPDGKRNAFHDELEGIVYSQAGKAQESETSFRKALQKEPDRLSSLNFLAALHFRNGQLDEALKDLEESIKKKPSQPRAFETKGVIYENLGKMEDAKTSYIQALQLDPSLAGAANNLAYILAEEGRDLTSALKWAQLARRSQPDSPSSADTLGWTYYKMGNYLLAQEQLQFAASRQPENGVFQYHLGMVLKATKQIGEAQKALKKAADNFKNSKEKSLAQAELKTIASLK